MRGRKEALWAVVISAALVTAGLILSCGDENGDNGGAAVDCQAACEKLKACYESPGPFGETIADCVEACEEELAGAKGSLVEVFECIPETDCQDIIGTCFCQPFCEKASDCAPEDDGFPPMAYCVYMCQEEETPLELLMCVLNFSSCQFIYSFCWD